MDHIYQTVLADLLERCLDAEFDDQFSETGRFKKVTVKGRGYWYFAETVAGKEANKYVGPFDDPEITNRVGKFNQIKDDFKARRKLVSSLVNDAGLPRPDALAGDLIEAFWKGGLFRLRAVIVGSAAFQCYAGYLGVRITGSRETTQDIDFAQFHAVSISVADSISPVLEILQSADPTYRIIPDQMDGRVGTKFVNKSGFKVEFLTPNASSSDYQGRPAKMPALGGAAAQPLRYLDFLIAQPVRSVVLHKGGIPVLIPSPERYAVHKLIVATLRKTDDNGDLKSGKDIRQASALISALVETRRGQELGEVWNEAMSRGDHWKAALKKGRLRLDDKARQHLDESIELATPSQ